MRASRQVRNRGGKEGEKSRLCAEMHISGAEGLYEDDEAEGVVGAYVKRARSHPRGGPDRIVVTIEKIMGKPLKVRALPVRTLDCSSPRLAGKMIGALLGLARVSARAAAEASALLKSGEVLRGAAVFSAITGRRVDPDRKRGVRVSSLGIMRQAEEALSAELNRTGIDSPRVKEALVLASKVASCKEVRAELCVSDNPDYTTGYVSSREFGYIRIPHIKRKGEKRGGRIFFLDEGADFGPVMHFLEETPVLVNALSGCLGVFSFDELIGDYHQ